MCAPSTGQLLITENKISTSWAYHFRQLKQWIAHLKIIEFKNTQCYKTVREQHSGGAFVHGDFLDKISKYLKSIKKNPNIMTSVVINVNITD